MKVLVSICRVLVGILFIFSGLIKINDPMGFSYKLQEYFVVFHMSWLNGYTVGLSIFICSMEIVLGIAILLGLKSRLTTLALLLLTLFFTFLTFYSAWFNKVTECGCFGDAIPMTPWQSFIKNLFLLALIAVLCFGYKLIKPILHDIWGWLCLAAGTAACISFGMYTYSHLPVIDFLPYKIGAHLPDLMKVPAGAPADEFAVFYTLKNKKTGDLKKYSDKEYLSSKIYENKDWAYVSATDPVLVKAGYQAPLKDFRISDANGNDFTNEIINTPGYLILIDEFDLHDTNRGIQSKLNELATRAQDFHIRTIGLTSVSSEDAEEFCKQVNPMYELFYCDETPLKSMVRANPGIVLLRNGTIVNKWHYNDLPDYESLKRDYFQAD